MGAKFSEEAQRQHQSKRQKQKMNAILKVHQNDDVQLLIKGLSKFSKKQVFHDK